MKIVSGDMPETGSEVSVFIDIIGMPLTPISYAGVARRSFRRWVLYRTNRRIPTKKLLENTMVKKSVLAE